MDIQKSSIQEEENVHLSSDLSDSSDNEENSEIENEAIKKLEEVNLKLIDLPNSYELLVEKVSLLQVLGELKELRTTRSTLSALYPLTPEIWLSWIEDEANLVVDEEDRASVIELFERALQDYQSVKVWVKYIEYYLEPESNKSIDECRILLERALAAVGLNAKDGHLVWEAYRDFELKNFVTKGSEESRQKLVSLCTRQLSIPLQNMTQAYDDIKTLFQIDEVTEQNFHKALEQRKVLEEWESKLVNSSNSAEVYLDYIEFEKQHESNPSRIICLFERAISDNPLQISLWVKYINYASSKLNIGDVVLPIAERATKNCPWEISLWCQWMHQLEKYSQLIDKLRSVFEKGLVYCTRGEDAGSLWLAYLQFLRRRIHLDDIVEADVELFMKTISAAEEHLMQMLPEPPWDCIAEILLYGIRSQAHITKSMIKPRKLWYQALNKGYGKEFKFWIQFFQLEQRYGDVKSVRKSLEKAMSVMTDGIEVIAELWLNFERDFGDISCVKFAEEKVTEALNTKYEQEKQSSFQKLSKSQKRKLKRKGSNIELGEQALNEKKLKKNDEIPSSSKKDSVQNNDKDVSWKKPFPPSSGSKKVKSSGIVTNPRRPQKSFVPRSLQVQSGTKHETIDLKNHTEIVSNNQNEEQKFKKPLPMTNADFRNFLRNK